MQAVIKTMGKRGEIVLPKEIRDCMNLKPNSKVEIVGTKRGALILPAKTSFKDLVGLFGKSKVDAKDFDAILFEMIATG